jgi:hypothetical protein
MNTDQSSFVLHPRSSVQIRVKKQAAQEAMCFIGKTLCHGSTRIATDKAF